MPLLTVILVLVAIGVIMWLVDKYIPMQPTIKRILMVVVIIIVIIWLLSAFGVLGSLKSVKI